MRAFFLSLSMFFVVYLTKAQDQIFTTEGDTIDCEITKLGEEYIHFSVFDKSGVLLVRSRLPLSKIEDYRKANIMTTDKEVLDLEQVHETYEFGYSLFRLALNTGFTYQFGGYDGLPAAYKEQLQSLWNFGGQFHFFLSESFGLGFKYNYIFTNANHDFDNPLQIDRQVFISSIRDEKVSFRYAALSLMFRSFYTDDQIVHYYIAGGSVRYRADGLGDGTPFYQEGETFGLTLGMSYDFMPVPNIGLGVGVEFNLARLSEFDSNGTVLPADFDLTRVDFTLGVRFVR